MDISREQLALAATKLAAALPLATLELVARVIEVSSSPLSARHRLAQELPHPQYRNLASGFFDQWQSYGAKLSAQTVSMMVLTAAYAEQAHRDAQSVELVWTGPESAGPVFRRTEQAILQVLDSATERITLVSYAVYRIPFICDALVRAARRGVRITIIVETPDRVAGEKEYSTLKALGLDVGSCCSLYYWPKENRPASEGGKLAILHVKCAAADGRWLYLSSANLTEYAFSINMELGILITGGSLPDRIDERFNELIERGTLLPCA